MELVGVSRVGHGEVVGLGGRAGWKGGVPGNVIWDGLLARHFDKGTEMKQESIEIVAQ